MTRSQDSPAKQSQDPDDRSILNRSFICNSQTSFVRQDESVIVQTGASVPLSLEEEQKIFSFDDEDLEKMQQKAPSYLRFDHSSYFLASKSRINESLMQSGKVVKEDEQNDCHVSYKKDTKGSKTAALVDDKLSVTDTNKAQKPEARSAQQLVENSLRTSHEPKHDVLVSFTTSQVVSNNSPKKEHIMDHSQSAAQVREPILVLNSSITSPHGDQSKPKALASSAQLVNEVEKCHK